MPASVAATAAAAAAAALPSLACGARSRRVAIVAFAVLAVAVLCAVVVFVPASRLSLALATRWPWGVRAADAAPPLCVFWPRGAGAMLESTWLLDHVLAQLPRELVLLAADELVNITAYVPAVCADALVVSSVAKSCAPALELLARVPQDVARGHLSLLVLSDENCACDTRTFAARVRSVLRQYDCDDVREGGAAGVPAAVWVPNGPSAAVGLPGVPGARALRASRRRTECAFAGRVRGVAERVEMHAWFASHEGSHPCVYAPTAQFGDGADGRDYRVLLSNTVFALAPPGRGRNPDTFRLWEALEAGAIPVLVRRAGWPHALELDSACPVPRIDSLDELGALLAMSGGQRDDLQRRVALWYADFKRRVYENVSRALAHR